MLWVRQQLRSPGNNEWSVIVAARRVMTDKQIRILGFAGSLRRASYNRGLLRAAREDAPDGVDIGEFDLSTIPLFNEDVEARGDPPPVRELKEHIRAADALLIATPEYNYSIPGVLKNAIDWASRPPRDSPLLHKPIALMGASPGGFGTVRSQLALRQVFVFTKSYVLLEPEVHVSAAGDKFDAEGNLIDAETRRNVRALVMALVEWARLSGADQRVIWPPKV
jgi:chromate reductase, NAD(P)H dehydrogenase (quinone)